MKNPLIIAEFCQNHNGSKDIMMQMLDKATEAGADYAKLQSIRSANLTNRTRFENGEISSDGLVKVIRRPFAEEKQRLQKLDLTVEEEAEFVDACKATGIKSMTTVFDRSTVVEVSTLGFDAVKVASYDCGSLPLIKDLCEVFTCLFVSTGASTDIEIQQTADFLAQNNVQAYLMHCVTIYPTPKEAFHLARILFLRMMSRKVGLSSHPDNNKIGIVADQVALALGVDVIERHFTILPEKETRDGLVSITPSQVHELRQFANLPLEDRIDIVRLQIPDWQTYLGSAIRELSQTELLNRDYYRGRFATQQDQDNWLYNWEET